MTDYSRKMGGMEIIIVLCLTAALIYFAEKIGPLGIILIILLATAAVSGLRLLWFIFKP